MPEAASTVPPGFRSAMVTPSQSAIEETLLRVLAEPRVVAAREEARRLLEESPEAGVPDGEARLDDALGAWLVFLAFLETNGDPGHPHLCWTLTGTRRHWLGRAVPKAASWADCPDNVYRLAPIDPDSSYVIRGQLRPLHPAQFSFMIVRDRDLIPREDDNEILGIITDREMAIAADGSFEVTVGPEAPAGRLNHLQTKPGDLIRLCVRDTLSSWLQSPNELSLSRVAGPPAGSRSTEREIADRVAAKMSEWVRGWLAYGATIRGPREDNCPAVPQGRAGGWGYISFVPFDLSEDTAIVLTIDDGAAEYASNQILDVWGVQLDPLKTIASHTAPMSRPNPDGTYTYVVSAQDPGAANWLDTGGMRRGWLMTRWQGIPRTRLDGDGLVRDFRVVDVAALAAVLPEALLGVSRSEREAELRRRQALWGLRLAEGTR